jgi:CheY-like chemotaxis protein
MPVALVVEDNPDLLGYMTLALEMTGWVVLSAPDAASALHLMQGDTPDIVFTDFAMPGGNGIDLAHDLHSRPGLGGIPIVVVTGQPGALSCYATDGQLPGISGVLTKPVTVEELQHAAEHLRDGALTRPLKG